MSFIESVKSAVKKTTKDVAKISGDAVEFTKLKIKINETSIKIDDAYKVIGEQVYLTTVNEEADSELIEKKCDEITSLKCDLEELKDQLCIITNKKVCDNCGTKNNSKSLFCSKCGEKFVDVTSD